MSAEGKGGREARRAHEGKELSSWWEWPVLGPRKPRPGCGRNIASTAARRSRQGGLRLKVPVGARPGGSGVSLLSPNSVTLERSGGWGSNQPPWAETQV